MTSFFSTALITFLISLVLGICLTSAILQLTSRLPWLARPSSNRLHVAPTPVWGGVAIFVSFACIALFRGLFDNFAVIATAFAAACMFLLGLIDDIWKLKPRWKLLGQVACAFIPLSFVFRHPLTGNRVVDVFLALLWIVGVTNAFNLLDNINGLSAGTAVLVSSFQAALFLSQGEPVRALASIALSGSIVGFLLFNFPKGRVFMGDSGSLFIGFWLAATALSATKFSQGRQLSFLLFPLLVMAVPICDTTLVTLTRILKGHPISLGGTDHLSHRLIAYGFSRTSAVLMLWAFSGLSGALAVFATSYSLSPLLSLVALLLVAAVLFGTYLTRFELHTQSTLPLPPVQHPRVAAWVRIPSRVLLDLILIVAAYYTAYLLRFDGDISPADRQQFVSTITELVLIKLGVFVVFGAHRPWWDYFGLKDAYRLMGSSVLASLIAVTYFSTVYRFYGFSRIVFALDFLVFTMLTLALRFSFRLFDELAPANHRTNVLIYGADSEGETALQLVSKHYRFRVVGFLDDDRKKRDSSIHSVPIRGCTQDLKQIASEWNAPVVLLTPSTTEETKRKLLAICSDLDIRLLRLQRSIEDLTAGAGSSAPQVSLAGDLVAKEVPEPASKVLSRAGSS